MTTTKGTAAAATAARDATDRSDDETMLQEPLLLKQQQMQIRNNNGNNNNRDNHGQHHHHHHHSSSSSPRRPFEPPLTTTRNQFNSSTTTSSTTTTTPPPPHFLLRDVSDIDRVLPHAAVYSFLVWLVLLVVVYSITDEWQYLDAEAAHAATLAAASVGMATVLLMMVPLVLLVRQSSSMTTTTGSAVAMTQQQQYCHSSSSSTSSSHISGIVFAAMVTQLVALVTNLLLAYAPVPVRTDPVTHAPVYLVRWCEWIPLAGLMTFLSEAIDIPKHQHGWRWPVWTAVSQSVSCACAMVFPFCTSVWTWSAWMVLAMLTYACMFPRCWMKWHTLQRTERGTSLVSLEYYDRIQFAYRLMMVCTVVWTVLVVLYFGNMLVYRTLDETHWLRQYPVAMMVDTGFDVLAKALYMKLIVDVHAAVFDREGRAQRQLSELRRLMSVLWDSSSDVICISVSPQGTTRITSMLSPSFLPLIGGELPTAELKGKSSVALMIDTQVPRSNNPQESSSNMQVVSAFYVDR